MCREQRFRHQWRTADHLAALCHKWFPIPEPLHFTGNDVNTALLRDSILKLDIAVEKSSPNEFGIYHDAYRPWDANNRKSLHCYYLCNPEHKECVKSSPVAQWVKAMV
jgi:hypothetical protein